MQCVILFISIFNACLARCGCEVNAQGNKGEQKADFLFQKPKTSFGFRGGLFFPQANDGVFDMVTEELTIEKSDFRSWDLGFDFGFSLHTNLELTFSLDFSSRSKNSEFRDYVDDQGLPITQSTKYSQIPLTAGIKYLLIPRGRQIGQYSWIPSRYVTYLSAGSGFVWYEFSQSGDFVDYETLEIFSARLESSSFTLTGYLGCGAELNINRSAYLSLDYRYYLAEDEMEDDYVGFDSSKLGGSRLTVGIRWFF